MKGLVVSEFTGTYFNIFAIAGFQLEKGFSSVAISSEVKIKR
jgi:hypothetical protein